MPGSITRSWGNQIPRMCMQLHFVHVETGRGFWFLNTHTDHLSELSRTKAAELIVRKLPSTGEPVVLVGDFNAAPAEDCVATIKRALIDVVEKFAPKEAGRGTFHGFSGADIGPTNRIDYVFASPGTLATSVVVDRTKYDSGRMPSDHFPIIADLLWH